MPVARRRVQRAPPQLGLPELPDHIEQSNQPSQYMQHVGGREQVEEGTAGIGGKVKPFSAEPGPGHILASHKEQTEDQGYVEPARGTFTRDRYASHESSYSPACDLQRDATAQKQRRVQVENRRQCEALP